MKKIVIFGSGNHAQVIFHEIINLKKYKILGFIDETKKKIVVVSHKNKKYYNLGDINQLLNSRYHNICGIIAIGNNDIRKEIFNKVNKINKFFKWEKIISKNAIINNNVKIGDGSMICSNVLICNDTVIGNHCLINSSSSIDHNNTLEDFSSIGPGAITGGNVIIKKNSFIGIGSIIKDKIEIGKNTIVWGNSYVTKNCLNNSIYFGTPAKKIKKLV